MARRDLLTRKNAKQLKDIGLSLEKAIKSIMNDRTTNRVAQQVIVDIKKRVARGQNPIREWPRRYEKYKNATVSKGKRRGYPFSVQKQYPNKKQRPVNLQLSSDMLGDMDYTIDRNIPGSAKIDIDYQTDLSKNKESGHREGVNGQPKRPILALTEKKEQYISPIQRNARTAVQARVQKVIKDFNKRSKRVR